MPVGKFTDAERLARASLRVAMHIRGLWEEKGSSDTCLLESFFLPDELTQVGVSRAFDGRGHREHVVPRLVIVTECHRMLEDDNATDEAIANLIRENVKIVIISHEERDRLDRRDKLGLRQKMPDGWKFGDDVFARLTAAEIEWEAMRAPAPTGPPA
jgi:hypothetical protein